MLEIAGLVLRSLAGFLVWRACDRIWHGLVIAAVAVLLLPPVAIWLTGDVSRYLPAETFAGGAEGKDHVPVVSMAATILVAVMLASCTFGAAKAAWWRQRR
jgi:hypothetical protein